MPTTLQQSMMDNSSLKAIALQPEVVRALGLLRSAIFRHSEINDEEFGRAVQQGLSSILVGDEENQVDGASADVGHDIRPPTAHDDGTTRRSSKRRGGTSINVNVASLKVDEDDPPVDHGFGFIESLLMNPYLDLHQDLCNWDDNNNLLHEISMNDLHFLKIQQEAFNFGKTCLPASTRANALNTVQIGFLFNYPPEVKEEPLEEEPSDEEPSDEEDEPTDVQDHTEEDDEPTDDVEPTKSENQQTEDILHTNGNSIPQNTTPFHALRPIIDVMSTEYQFVDRGRATSGAMQSIMFMDVCPVTGPNKNYSGTEAYNAVRKQTDPHVKKYIEMLLEKMPNLKVLIIFGGEAWKFYQENKDGLFAGLTVCQHSPVVHTSVIPAYKPTKRQLDNMYYSFHSTLAHLTRQSPPHPNDPDRMAKALSLFSKRSTNPDEYVYVLSYGGADVLIARSHTEMRNRLRDLVAVNNQDIPPKQEIIAKEEKSIEFKGATIRAVDYFVHDKSLPFGLQEQQDEALNQWIRAANLATNMNHLVSVEEGRSSQRVAASTFIANNRDLDFLGSFQQNHQQNENNAEGDA